MCSILLIKPQSYALYKSKFTFLYYEQTKKGRDRKTEGCRQRVKQAVA